MNNHAVLAANDGTHGSELMTLVPVPLLPPYVAAIPTQSATIGQTFGLDVGAYASDPNTPALPITFSLGAGAPSGAHIDPNTGVFVWTPSAGQPTGPTTITIDVSDNQSPPDTTVATFTIDVLPVPAVPPILRAVSQAANANVGQEFTFDVSSLASDPNTPPLPLSYSIAPGAPAGVSINPTTGLLSWSVPATERIGNYAVTVIASDNSSPPKTASETLTIAVVDPGSPPSVSTPVVSTKQGLTITFTFSEPVDPATAANVNNYILTMPSKKLRVEEEAGPAADGDSHDRELQPGHQPGHAQGEEAEGGYRPHPDGGRRGGKRHCEAHRAATGRKRIAVRHELRGDHQGQAADSHRGGLGQHDRRPHGKGVGGAWSGRAARPVVTPKDAFRGALRACERIN